MLKDADSYDTQFIRALFNRNKFETLQNLLPTLTIKVYLYKKSKKMKHWGLRFKILIFLTAVLQLSLAALTVVNSCSDSDPPYQSEPSLA